MNECRTSPRNTFVFAGGKRPANHVDDMLDEAEREKGGRVTTSGGPPPISRVARHIFPPRFPTGLAPINKDQNIPDGNSIQ